MNKNEINQADLKKIDEAYSSEPWWYDIRGFFILTFAYRSTLGHQIRLFGSGMGAKHLEAAIGTGSLFELILKWRRWKKMPPVQILGFDYADRMLQGAKHRFRNEPSIKLIRADIQALPVEDGTFDTANIANAIHCLPDVESGFREIHRVLKPGGVLIGNVLLHPRGKSFLDALANRINDWGMKKGILLRPYQADEVRDLLRRTGFEILEERVGGNCFDFRARKPVG